MVLSIAMKHQQFNLTSVICQQIVKWLNSSIWLIYRTLPGTTTPGQSGPVSKGNEGVLHNFRSSKTDSLVSYLGHSLLDGVLLLCKDAVGVSYRHSQ